MSSKIITLSPTEIYNLLPALPARQREILLFHGSGNSKKINLKSRTLRAEKQKIRRSLRRLKQICRAQGIPIDKPVTIPLLLIPLEAPLEILDLPRRASNALRKLGCTLVGDIYKHKLTRHSLLRKSGVGKVALKALTAALKELNLPPLAEHSPDTLIYNFHNDAKRQRLEEREKYLLKAVEWGNVDKRDALKEAKLPHPGHFEHIDWSIYSAKQKLTDGSYAQQLQTAS